MCCEGLKQSIKQTTRTVLCRESTFPRQNALTKNGTLGLWSEGYESNAREIVPHNWQLEMAHERKREGKGDRLNVSHVRHTAWSGLAAKAVFGAEPLLLCALGGLPPDREPAKEHKEYVTCTTQESEGRAHLELRYQCCSLS